MYEVTLIDAGSGILDLQPLCAEILIDIIVKALKVHGSPCWHPCCGVNRSTNVVCARFCYLLVQCKPEGAAISDAEL